MCHIQQALLCTLRSYVFVCLVWFFVLRQEFLFVALDVLQFPLASPRDLPALCLQSAGLLCFSFCNFFPNYMYYWISFSGDLFHQILFFVSFESLSPKLLLPFPLSTFLIFLAVFTLFLGNWGQPWHGGTQLLPLYSGDRDKKTRGYYPGLLLWEFRICYNFI